MRMLPPLCIISLSLAFYACQALAAVPFGGAPYCSVPPGPGSGVKANVLLMLDNSASAADLAYTDPSLYCIDESYKNDASYSGYFEEKTIYRYDSDRFLPEAGEIPTVSDCTGVCTVSTPYLYVEMGGAAPNRRLQAFKASGNFLNWLSMSKLDIEKKVLTGGKYDTANGLLLAESRGCQGKRFIKLLPDLPQITFAVRGAAPNPPKTGYIFEYLPTSPGGTQIEIYDKSYRKVQCEAAINNWKQGKGADFRKNVRLCMGDEQLMKDPRLPAQPSREKIYLDIRSSCYLNPSAPSGTGDEACMACWLRTYYVYEGNRRLSDIRRFDPDSVCGVASHPYFSDTNNDKGFLGIYFNSGSFGYNTNSALKETKDFCRTLLPTAVPDPSATAIMPTVGSNLPGYVLDAPLFTLGNPAATMQVRVSLPAPPSGLIQHFSSKVNFGAMVFNANGGAGGECGAGNLHCGTCRKYGGAACSVDSDCIRPAGYGPCSANRCAFDSSRACSLDIDCVTENTDFGPCDAGSGGSDGGKIISYINDEASPLGDHASGLISAIDSVGAGTWSPLAESFYNAIGYFAHRTDLRLQSGDFDENKPPSRFTCQRNNVIMVSDGISSADRNAKVNELVAQQKSALPGVFPASATTGGGESSPPLQGSFNLDDLAWLARHRNISNLKAEPAHERDYISTYVVYTGTPCTHNADGSCNPQDEAVPEHLMQLTAKKGGGKFARADSPSAIEGAFRHALQEIAAGSGTDTSIVSSGDGNGAIFLREQFYPRKSFDGGATFSYWIGEMQSLWYYIDPFLGGSDGSGSTIREDTDGDHQLTLDADRVVSYDTDTNLTYATGPAGKTQVEMDQLTSLWRAGLELWRRDAARNIKTTLNGTSLMPFVPGQGDALAPYLNVSAAEAPGLIDFVHGKDAAGYRSRTVAISENGVTTSRVWKLGDIISSTPRAQTPTALGAYHLSPPRGYNDFSYLKFIRSDAYKGRGMVYVGANDGMLHAFRLGTLDDTGSGKAKATLTGSDLGTEAWAFVPKNALPFLRYLAEPGYQHLYYVDGTPLLFDASIRDHGGSGCRDGYQECAKSERSWMTVLIAGMGLGGASALTCAPGGNCVQVPRNDPADGKLGLGYSSYFAIDVTDPENPALLWEFSSESLGFSTTGPAIVRVGPRDKNGRWFAVFGSGPTGPVLANSQFGGSSDQQLRFFVVDLRTGALVKQIETGIYNAFSGSLAGGAIDADKWNPAEKGHYQDDAIYVGYTEKGESGAWTGGVLRIVTRESDKPDQWGVSKVAQGLGPVTGGVGRLQDRRNHRLWLYFGLGRYFFGQDDPGARRALYGVKEPCYNYGAAGDLLVATCTDSAAIGRPGAGAAGDTTSTEEGWRIDLDPVSVADSLGAERTTSTPTTTAGGAVFFPTFRPSTDPCLAGESYLWGVSYDTGGELPQKLPGKVLVPLSSGATRDGAMNMVGRRAAAVAGRPGGAKVVSNSGLRPVKKIIQIQER